jgi:hypothetical protein
VELPVRILAASPAQPVVSVDGLTAEEGLHLSHWPGHRTPEPFRHDLSTGCALAFARASEEERRRRVADATAFVNNHYDTDGCLALLAARHPAAALPRAERMLAAAAAGDFFRWPDDEALAVDAIVTGLADEGSPLAGELAGLDDLERWERSTLALLDALPGILDGDLAPWRALWEPVLATAHLDREDLSRCQRVDAGALDLSTWTAPPGARSTRPGAERFDPGRHAFFGESEHDRALVIAPGPDGTSYRLVLSTLSWFDLVSRPRRPRPDLARLAARLNELEATEEAGLHAWRAQATTNASPELWFGVEELASFSEHNRALAPSRLAPDVVEREIARALTPRA